MNTLKNVLLVEGKDDEHVLKHVSRNRQGPRFDITTHGGIQNLLQTLPVRLKAAAHNTNVGIVVDADTDASARWDSVRDRLVDLGYPGVPAQPHPEGTILEPPDKALLPRVGVWMMPDNRSAGILEDFLRFLVPAGSRLFEYVENSVARIPESELRFTPVNQPKARIHTWLAWQKEPGKPLGLAIAARYLDPDVPEADALVVWLKRLFGPEQ